MGEDPRLAKSALRRALLQARRALPEAERTRLAAGVCARLIRLSVVMQARHLAAYAAIGGEVDPAPAVDLVRSLGATTYYPAGDPGALRLLAASRHELVTGPQGIPCPTDGAELAATDAATVLLVPGVGFTPDGRRLGRGAGEYDRLLIRYPAALRIGIACEMQLVPELPDEPWDQRVHLLVTEARLFASLGPPAHPSKENHP
jgi:5-formyltetrahydrofolate cyclo-ligase